MASLAGMPNWSRRVIILRLGPPELPDSSVMITLGVQVRAAYTTLIIKIPGVTEIVARLFPLEK